MQTRFAPERLAGRAIAAAESNIRKCVHCGFCAGTCPTYLLLGDERDSPRGRIYLIKEMLENDRPANQTVATHIDRCLSCLACTTTCPSGVDYGQLVDQAREHIEQTYRRPLTDRLMRAALSGLLTRPRLFRLALIVHAPMRALTGAAVAAFARLAPKNLLIKRLKALSHLAPARLSATTRLPAISRPPEKPGAPRTNSAPRKRVALLAGCVQQAVAQHINEATLRLLTRHGVEVFVDPQTACCGGLPFHIGKGARARTLARRTIDAWTRLAETEQLDAILINMSGCGTTVKHYAEMLADDPAYTGKAAAIAKLTMDVTEFLGGIDLAPAKLPAGLTIAYHATCSLQHGQRVIDPPKQLLAATGAHIVEPTDAHLCCGSAGVYNILQPDMASALRERKAERLRALKPDMIASGNLGCMMQLAQSLDVPLVHTVELLDWATGGPAPKGVTPTV